MSGLITGSLGRGRSAAVLAQLQDDDFEPVDAWTVGLWRDGEWRAEHPLDFKPVAVAPWVDTWAVLGASGELCWVDEGGTRRERQSIARGVGFTHLRHARGELVALGMGRAALRFDGEAWHPLGTGLPPTGPGELRGFETLVEAADALYAAGWGGELWRLEGASWKPTQTQTKQILTGGTALPSGEALICGRDGTLLRGRGEHFATLGKAPADLWSAATFRGRVFVASLSEVFELVGDRLTSPDGTSVVTDAYHLSANDALLLSVGSSSVVVFDGETWTPLT